MVATCYSYKKVNLVLKHIHIYTLINIYFCTLMENARIPL